MMDIKTIQHKLNSRPRKNLNYQKPFDVFYKFVNGKIAFAS
jgi:IS30 family transposase